jgi:hypothetical protein
MLSRFIYGENAHRKGIYREALNLTREGWYVMANCIPGFHVPPEIEGYIPDIYAVKGDNTCIIDLVIQGDPVNEICSAHSEYARHDSSTRYYCWILNYSGGRQTEFMK